MAQFRLRFFFSDLFYFIWIGKFSMYSFLVWLEEFFLSSLGVSILVLEGFLVWLEELFLSSLGVSISVLEGFLVWL